MPLYGFRSYAVISLGSDEHPGVARPWPGGDNTLGGQASYHEAYKAIGAFLLPRAATRVSLVAVEGLRGATPRGQPWAPAMAQPHGRDGLRARRMVVLWTCRAPALCRRVHRACMRHAWLDYTPILPATACHQSSYVETYRRSMPCRLYEQSARSLTYDAAIRLLRTTTPPSDQPGPTDVPADRCARASAELELGRGRQHLEHLPAPARKRAALRCRAVAQLPTALGIGHELAPRLGGDIETAEHLHAPLHEGLGGQAFAAGHEALDHVLHARQVRPPQILGGKVDALHQGPAVDPFVPRVPA